MDEFMKVFQQFSQHINKHPNSTSKVYGVWSGGHQQYMADVAAWRCEFERLENELRAVSKGLKVRA